MDAPIATKLFSIQWVDGMVCGEETKLMVTVVGAAATVVSTTVWLGEPAGRYATVAMTLAVPAMFDGVYVTVAAPVDPVLVVVLEKVPAAVVPAVALQVIGTPDSPEVSVAVKVTGAVPATKLVSEDDEVIETGLAIVVSVNDGPT